MSQVYMWHEVSKVSNHLEEMKAFGRKLMHERNWMEVLYAF